MPSACFDAIRNVSTPWKHAEGMSLRYGAVIFGDLTHRLFYGFNIKFFPNKMCNEIPLAVVYFRRVRRCFSASMMSDPL